MKFRFEGKYDIGEQGAGLSQARKDFVGCPEQNIRVPLAVLFCITAQNDKPILGFKKARMKCR